MKNRNSFFVLCNQEACQRVESSEDLGSDLESIANELSEAIKDNAANREDNWKEKFFDMKKKLSRIKSEKAVLNISSSLCLFRKSH